MQENFKKNQKAKRKEKIAIPLQIKKNIFPTQSIL